LNTSQLLKLKSRNRGNENLNIAPGVPGPVAAAVDSSQGSKGRISNNKFSNKDNLAGTLPNNSIQNFQSNTSSLGDIK
jgi:hypothetical protein